MRKMGSFLGGEGRGDAWDSWARTLWVPGVGFKDWGEWGLDWELNLRDLSRSSSRAVREENAIL